MFDTRTKVEINLRSISSVFPSRSEDSGPSDPNRLNSVKPGSVKSKPEEKNCGSSGRRGFGRNCNQLYVSEPGRTVSDRGTVRASGTLEARTRRLPPADRRWPQGRYRHGGNWVWGPGGHRPRYSRAGQCRGPTQCARLDELCTSQVGRIRY